MRGVGRQRASTARSVELVVAERDPCQRAPRHHSSLPPHSKCAMQKKAAREGSFFRRMGGPKEVQDPSEKTVLGPGQLRSGTQLSPLPSLNNFDRHHSAWRGLESRRLIIKDGPHFRLNPCSIQHSASHSFPSCLFPLEKAIYRIFTLKFWALFGHVVMSPPLSLDILVAAAPQLLRNDRHGMAWPTETYGLTNVLAGDPQKRGCLGRKE